MRAAILIAAIIAMTLVAVWIAGAPVQSNDCWVLPQYEGNSSAFAQDQVISKCLRLWLGQQTTGISVPTYGVVVRADGCTVNPCNRIRR